MGRVILLAGAPDAASLDWSLLDGLEDQSEEPSQDAWRPVPWQRQDSVHDKSDLPSASAHDTIDKDKTIDETIDETIDTPQDWPDWPVGDGSTADFVTFDTTAYAFDDTRAFASAPASSVDPGSLSIHHPGALPVPAPDVRLGEQNDDDDRDDDSQLFFEHSLALHDALPSSLPDPTGFAQAETDTSVSEPPRKRLAISTDLQRRTSTDDGPSPRLPRYVPATLASTTAPTQSQAETVPALPPAIPPWHPLTRLADIPSAHVLTHLAARTVTVNLVVAVVAVRAPRLVAMRPTRVNLNAPPLELVEIVVGDDTRSGFGMTIWLDGPSPLRDLLPTLRPRDTLLVRRLALHVFRERVYGSSLRRQRTHVHVLRRARVTDNDDSLFSDAHLASAGRVLNVLGTEASPPPAWKLAAAAHRVREWALQSIVGAGSAPAPPDTQSNTSA